MPPISLRHIHIPDPIPYTLANAIQTHLISLHHKYRAATKSILSIPPSIPPRPPPPTLLTFSVSEPTYTVGRRYLTRNPVPQSQIDYLTCTPTPSTTATTATSTSTSASTSSQPSSPTSPPRGLAHFHPTHRGGDLTYHAPGQLTAYPLLNLRHQSLTARCYIALLERTVIRTAAAFGVSNTTTTDDPGVWIWDRDPHDGGTAAAAAAAAAGAVEGKAGKVIATRKLAALGIRIGQGGLTSHGIGLNVYDAPLPQDFLERYKSYEAQRVDTESQTAAQSLPDSQHERGAQGYLSWGFQRITACGLPGKTSTWLIAEAERERELSRSRSDPASAPLNLSVHDVAPILAASLLHELNAWQASQIKGSADVIDEKAVMVTGIQRADEREIGTLIARGGEILARDGVDAVL